MLGLALRRLGDRGRAEDAVQEVFAAVWRSAATTTASAGRARRGSTRSRATRSSTGSAGGPHATVADAPELVSTSAPPDERGRVGVDAWRVHRALETLPEHERTVIELAYWRGLSQSEIADFLSIPLGTVKTRTRSALARLADELEGELR